MAIGDVPRIYGLQNPQYLKSEWHASYIPLLRTSRADGKNRATKNGTGSKLAMLLGNAGDRDERSLDIEKAEHCLFHGERIRDETTANRRGARMEAFGRDQIRDSEEP